MSEDHLVYILDLETFDFVQDENEPEIFIFDRDCDNWIALFVQEFNLENEEVTSFLSSILKSEKLVRHVVLYQYGILVGTGAIILDKKLNTGLSIAIYGLNYEFLKLIISDLGRHCLDNSITKITIEFTHLDENSDKISPYRNMGFKKLKR